MEHKIRLLNRARLDLVKLEDRVTPTSMLFNAIDLGDLADVITPEKPQARVVKRVADSDKVQIVSAPQTQQGGAANVAPQTSTPTQTPQGNRPAGNPALHAPMQQTQAERVTVGGRTMLRAEPVEEPLPLSSVILQPLGSSNLIVRHYAGSDNIGQRPGDGGGTRAQIWGVPPGACAAAPTAETYAAGFRGRIGSISKWTAAGTSAGPLNFMLPPDGHRVRINAITFDDASDTIYAVATERTAGGGLVANHVAALPCGGGGPTTVATFPAPPPATAGVTLLEDIDFEAAVPSGFPVGIVGTGVTAAGADAAFVDKFSAALVPSGTGTLISFSSSTGARAHGVATEGAGNPTPGARNIVGSLDRPVGNASCIAGAGCTVGLWFNFTDAQTITYASTATFGAGTADDKPSLGFYGVSVVGATIYQSGSLSFPGGNPLVGADVGGPEYDWMVVRHGVLPGAGAGAYFTGYAWPGGDYNARGSNAVNSAGDLIVGGEADSEEFLSPPGAVNARAITLGHLTQHDLAAGAPILGYRESGDCDGVDTNADGSALEFDTNGRSVAVHPDDSVSTGGNTTAKAANWSAGMCPAGDLPQPIADPMGYTGPAPNGYVFRDGSPVGT